MSTEKPSNEEQSKPSCLGAVSASVSVPAIRVRFYPKDTDETFDGTVIDEKQNYYVVAPDQNLMLTQNWNKKCCDVLR